jgi:hypothetical protein
MPADPPKHQLDTSYVDPSNVPPLCDEAEFTELIQEMVDDEAPRLFAIVQEYGDRVDAHVAGWGMWFGDRAVAFDVDGGTMIMRSMESAMRLFRGGPHVRPRLCWTGPEPAQHDDLGQHDE